MSIKSTSAQCKKLLNKPIGYGFIVWRSSENVTTEIEVIIRDQVVYNAHNGSPLSFEYGAAGLMKVRS